MAQPSGWLCGGTCPQPPLASEGNAMPCLPQRAGLARAVRAGDFIASVRRPSLSTSVLLYSAHLPLTLLSRLALAPPGELGSPACSASRWSLPDGPESVWGESPSRCLIACFSSRASIIPHPHSVPTWVQCGLSICCVWSFFGPHWILTLPAPTEAPFLSQP